ncbi:MAG: prolipoprotein diacylglyceryl transferase [Muribaculaceae bacterium]|jgi:prolipoprotein diacylglyceryl transferase|nr:prolipoprotein diacylglyceryl transferase [Muribaculaceae bacterium]
MLDFITWTFNPELISSPVTVRWYGLMFAIGFLVGYEIVWRMFRHEGAPEKWVGSLFVYVVVATFFGARFGHVFFYAWDYYSQHLGDILKVWEGGLASHGGAIGIVIAILLYSKYVTKKNPLWTFDRLVVPVPFVGALIRMGNLFNHEIYGGPTDLPWGFSFIDNIGAWMHGAQPIMTVPCHPTQIYEALCYLALFVVLMLMYWKWNAQRRQGLIFGVFFTVLFSARFLIEYVKNVQEPWEVGMIESIGMNMGQLLSVPFVIVGVILIVRALSRPAEDIKFPNKFADAK